MRYYLTPKGIHRRQSFHLPSKEEQATLASETSLLKWTNMPLSRGDFGMTASKVYSRAPGSLSQNTTDYKGLPRDDVGTFCKVLQVFSILTDLEHPVSECSTSVINDYKLLPDTPLSTPSTEDTASST